MSFSIFSCQLLPRVWRIPVSASSLRDPDFTSVLQRIASTLAPGSLIFTVARHPTSSAMLPYLPSSVLVIHPPISTSRLYSSGFTLSLRPSGSVGLLPPNSSLVPCCLAPLQSSGPLSPPWPSGSLAHWLFIFIRGIPCSWLHNLSPFPVTCPLPAQRSPTELTGSLCSSTTPTFWKRDTI